MKRKRLTAEAMIKKIMADDIDFLDDEIAEISTTGGVAGYQTPSAFVDTTDDEHTTWALDKTKSGYTRPVNKHFNTYKMWEMQSLGEATYRQYAKDETATAHQKVNTAIHEMNSKLFEIEKLVRQNVRLKAESGINKDSYWKSTQHKLGKIRERVMKLAIEIQKFGE